MHILVAYVYLTDECLLFPTWCKHNMSITIFLVLNIKTPSTIDFITSLLNLTTTYKFFELRDGWGLVAHSRAKNSNPFWPMHVFTNYPSLKLSILHIMNKFTSIFSLLFSFWIWCMSFRLRCMLSFPISIPFLSFSPFLQRLPP